MSTADSVLEVRDLTVDIPTRRGVVRAVDGVSFAVKAREAMALVGESGAGKSMTLRAILGLLRRPARIVRGEVRFEGREVAGLPPKAFRQAVGGRMTIVLQEPMTALNPVMRVGDQVAEGPRRRLGLSREAAHGRAVELLAEVGIPDPARRARTYPHELSGGLRQRVTIAIALSTGPRVILCDEPTTAMDVTIQDQILKLLARLRLEAEVALVLVTHDLAVVAQTCDRLAVMYAGQVVETGAVTDVFHTPRHAYTLGLLRSVPDFDRARGDLTSIPGAPPDLAAPPDGCRFHPRCPFATGECRSGEFPPLAVAEGRSTTCIHSDACVDSVRRHPIVARTPLRQPGIRHRENPLRQTEETER